MIEDNLSLKFSNVQIGEERCILRRRTIFFGFEPIDEELKIIQHNQNLDTYKNWKKRCDAPPLLSMVSRRISPFTTQIELEIKL